jgi:hypothetical protein
VIVPVGAEPPLRVAESVRADEPTVSDVGLAAVLTAGDAFPTTTGSVPQPLSLCTLLASPE